MGFNLGFKGLKNGSSPDSAQNNDGQRLDIFWHIIPTRYTSHRVYFYLTTTLHVSGITITHRQEHKTTVTTASGNRYTVLLSVAIVEGSELNVKKRLDMFDVLIRIIAIPYSCASRLIRFSSLHACFPLISPRFFMHYPRCNMLAVRTLNRRLLQCHFCDVALTPAGIIDITLSRMTLALAVIFCRGIGTRLQQRRSKRSKG